MLKFTILGCGSSLGVPRIDGDLENVILKKKKITELDVAPSYHQILEIL